MYHDYLILIGGVSFFHSFPLATVIDLATGTTVNFDLKVNCDDCLIIVV